MDAPLYLDHNSTTPIDPRVVEAMVRAWRECGANPASQHALGRKARRMLEDAREGIAELLGAKTGGRDADQVIFTSGGTEANNLALLGLIDQPDNADLFISPFEHQSVRGAAELLRSRRTNVQALPWADEFWRRLVEQEWRDGLLVVSFMLANNETGVIFPLEDVVQTCGPYGAYVHTDAVQAVGKIPVSFRKLGVDALTVAPHKFHGPLGIGAVVLRHEIKLRPQLFGGFQQGALRPGTENVALAVGFHAALQLAIDELPERAARMQSLREELERTIEDQGRRDAYPAIVIGKQAPRLPNTACLAFPGLDRQALVMALDLAGVACSTGSACASGSSEPSPTLIAMGLPREVIESAIRFSLGATTTAAEVAEAARRILKTVQHLRSSK